MAFLLQISTMNQILTKTDALNSNSSIRKEIDENFAQEIDTKNNVKYNFIPLII